MKSKTKRALGISKDAGKGDSCKVKNFKAYYENYALIDFKKRKKTEKEKLIEYINNIGKNK